MKSIYTLKSIGIAVILIIFLQGNSTAQVTAPPKEDHSYKPLKLNLSEDGKKYVRFIMWHQLWMTSSNLSTADTKIQITPSIRRSRFLVFAQVSSKFMILTHFGLNSLTPSNLCSLGSNGDAPQIFLHGAWGELKISNGLYIGFGLHYWKGLTRLSSASTLNFMTLDQARPFSHWHSLGITDQFARHLGVYAKGQIKGFDYRIALNSPMRNPIGAGKDYGSMASGLTYTGVTNTDNNDDPVGNYLLEGYFRYNFWDKESTKLPYAVGTYLGEKKILGIGTGFYMHPNGMYHASTGEHENVSHVAVDAFMELPDENGNMLHAYASFINYNYGKNYVSRWSGTGTNIYAQVGYFFKLAQLMPYIAYQNGNYKGFESAIESLDIGANYYVNGHNCKVTLEYHSIMGDTREAGIDTNDDVFSQLRLQLQIFL